MVMGDFNAKVGKEVTDGVTGKHGLGSRNEAGENLVEFSGVYDLIICNTWFVQPKRRLYTWTAPNGLYRNQIDYIMIKKRWSSSVQAVKTLPGACCDSDHELLCSTTRNKLRKIRKTTIPPRCELENIPPQYKIQVQNRFEALEHLEMDSSQVPVALRNCNRYSQAKT